MREERLIHQKLRREKRSEGENNSNKATSVPRGVTKEVSVRGTEKKRLPTKSEIIQQATDIGQRKKALSLNCLSTTREDEALRLASHQAIGVDFSTPIPNKRKRAQPSTLLPMAGLWSALPVAQAAP